jgi:hypothetical protein
VQGDEGNRAALRHEERAGWGTARRNAPGRALITGVPFANGGPPFLFDANAFKIPSLWGVKDTAPYFHDNSAKSLEDVAAHYARFLPLTPAPARLTQQDQQDIVAYLKLLE